MTDLVLHILNRVDGYLDTTAPLLARDRLRVGVRDVILQAATEDVKAVSSDAVTAHAREVAQAMRDHKHIMIAGGDDEDDYCPGCEAIIAAALLAATREAEAERDRLLVLEKDLNIFLNQQCDARLKAEAKADAARREQRELLKVLESIVNHNKPDETHRERVTALKRIARNACARQGCACQCCTHNEGSDCACDCHATGACAALEAATQGEPK